MLRSGATILAVTKLKCASFIFISVAKYGDTSECSDQLMQAFLILAAQHISCTSQVPEQNQGEVTLQSTLLLYSVPLRCKVEENVDAGKKKSNG